MAQDDTKKDGPLFIVDNSPGGRSGADYLREWCELARSFDIATGFFEIGSLLELDDAWQKLEKIRILMGDELTFRTKKAMLEAVQRRAEGALEKSLDLCAVASLRPTPRRLHPNRLKVGRCRR